jgi:hypothetical protein
MKANIYTIIITLSVIVSSCNNAQNQSLEERIKGDWVVTEAEGELKELNLGTRYTFDGTYLTTSKDDYEIKGTYTIKPDTLDWKLEYMEMNYPYHFEGNKLIIEPLGSGQKLVLEK